MAEAKLKTKIVLKDSLIGMAIGDTLIVTNRQFKSNVVRTMATRLKNEGYLFDVSDKGRIDDTVIIRLK